MPDSSYSLGYPTHTSDSDTNMHTARFVHTISEAGRLLPSASRWNSIELDFNLLPQSSTGFDSLPSRFSKSVDFNLVITDKKYFKRFVYISVSIVSLVTILVLLLHFLPHKHHHHGASKNLTLAISQALLFFDAQKSGILPKNNLVPFRGDSGLDDGNMSNPHANLQGGFYDSGNNVKFSFPTAYTVTLLSWTVIEYHQKYADIGELDHVKDIIKWGSDYLLRLFVPPNTTSDQTILYTQVGSTGNDTKIENDINCWQRPEDMSYQRPVSSCGSTASDLAGEIVAALSAASLVFKEDTDYSGKLITEAETLFELVTRNDSHKQGTYTSDACGGQARQFYNSSGYKDELVWGGTWLFLATGNISYLGNATDMFASAEEDEKFSERGIFNWNNKLTANSVLLTRLRFFHDLGYPYEDAFSSSSNRTDLLMCSYLSVTEQHFTKTDGGLILLNPDYGAPLQYAVTASFLSKLYSDYLDLLRRSSGSCSSTAAFSLDMLRSFSTSQVNYILGDNPMKMSYVVGYGEHYPTQVHHRAASIPRDGQRHSCTEGARWLNSQEPNPNVLIGAMVAGPDQNDLFLDKRDKPWFSEPSISSNAGLVAALIALHDPPRHSSNSTSINLGMDMMGIFQKVHLVGSAP